MKNLKKIILFISIFAIVTVIINSVFLYNDIEEQVDTIWLVYDILVIVASAITAIAFMIYYIKPIDFLIKNRHFKTFVIISCFSSILLAILAICAYNKFLQNVREIEHKVGGEQSSLVDEITLEMKQLEQRKSEGKITEEEYLAKKEEILSKIVKK